MSHPSVEQVARTMYERLASEHKMDPWDMLPPGDFLRASYMADARAALDAATADVDAMADALAEVDNYNLCEHSCGGAPGPFHTQTGVYACHYVRQAQALRDWMLGGGG